VRYSELGIEIRQARVKDAEGIARTHVASWQATYRGVMRDETLDALRVEERVAGWRERLRALNANPPPRQESCFVAVDGVDAVLGFARGGLARPLASGAWPVPYDGELYEIYLAPGAERRGIGSRLAHAVARHLAADGLRALLIWALAGNPNRHFYEALGGALVLTQVTVIAGESLPEVGYGWPDIQTIIQRTAMERDGRG
jgi:ribosomal protein S18 acetylase RimI-like enzyme